MHAIRLHAFGPPENLVLEELPDLEPGPGEVRIAVEASGVHLLDTSIRRGEEGPLPPPELPTVPGREVAGVVELEPPHRDDVVLVPSAAGGLGWLLVQSARAVGARVVAAARGERTDALSELGADMVVDYGEPGWEKRVRDELDGVTLVYDGVGGQVGRASLELLRPGGRLVMFGFSSGTPTEVTTADLLQRGISAGWSLGPRMAALPGGIPGLAGRALQMVTSGAWRPLLSTYSLADAARAHADLEERQALGKVVLVTGSR